MSEFVTDIKTIRARARQNMEQGPITDAYGADRKRVIEVLNEVLATELVCVLRYKRHYYTAQGINAAPVAAEFLEHAGEEQLHADMVAQRIAQLGGEPDFNPEGLATRSHSEYDASSDLLAMVREDLVAERIAVASYQEIIRWLGNDDPTTRRMMEELLATEEQHADDLLNILAQIEPAPSTNT
ncbi:MAG: bacterioferritin [Actinomycetota bacterium]